MMKVTRFLKNTFSIIGIPSVILTKALIIAKPKDEISIRIIAVFLSFSGVMFIINFLLNTLLLNFNYYLQSKGINPFLRLNLNYVYLVNRLNMKLIYHIHPRTK